MPDGFYNAMTGLKCPDHTSNPTFQSSSELYNHVLHLSRNGSPIPEISLLDVEKQLSEIKSTVSDFYSISSRHFLEAGPTGLNHLHSLLNLLIKNPELTTIPSLNAAWSIILCKGHGKPRPNPPTDPTAVFHCVLFLQKC